MSWVNRDSDGLPCCPDCGKAMKYDDINGRDMETMSGYPIEYFVCDNCGQQFEIIVDNIFPY